MPDLMDFINAQCGGVAKVASEAKVTKRAVYLWAQKDSLPRTEYTGESSHSVVLAQLSGVPADEIKQRFNPVRLKKGQNVQA